MSERSLVTMYRELLQTQGFAATIDADGLIWFSDHGREVALVPAEDARRLLQLIWRSEPLPADAVAQRSSAARCLAVSRSSGGKAYLEHGRIVARVDQFVPDPVQLPELFRTALASLQVVVTRLAAGPLYPAEYTADEAVRRGPEHAASEQELRALYRQLLPELGCRALIDLPSALMFRRRGGPYVLQIDESRQQVVELSFTAPHPLHDAERQRVTALCLEINRQTSCINVSAVGKHVTARIELAVAQRTALTAVLGFALQKLDEAAELLLTLFGAEQATSDAAHEVARVLRAGGRRGLVPLFLIGARHAPLVVSADGRLFVFTTVDNELLICDGVTAAVQQRIRAHNGTIRSLAISRDGQLLASSGDDRTVCIRRVADGRLLHTLDGPTSIVLPVVFCPDGSRVAAGCHDGTIRQWALTDGRLLLQLGGGSVDPDEWPGRELSVSDGIACLEYSPDGQLLAAAEGDTLCVWRSSDGALLYTSNRPGQPVEALRFSPDGRFLASGSTGGAIEIHHCADWQLHGEIRAGYFPLDLSFSPDSRRLAIGSSDEEVIIVRVAETAEERRLRGHGWTQTLAFSGDGERIVAGTNDGRVYCWETTSGELVYEDGATGAIGALRVAADRCYSRSEHSACVRNLTGDRQRIHIRAGI